jgi:succinate dehydrogenase / fumarate reductase cytochrome b subunit
MAVSILNRAAGSALYAGAIGLTLWLIAVAAGPETYAQVGWLLASPIGQAGLYLLVAALAFHLANGIRHLVFDTGAGLKPADAELTAWFAILFAIAAPVGLWALLSFGGLHR